MDIASNTPGIELRRQKGHVLGVEYALDLEIL